MKRPVLYVPLERGFERELKKRLDWFVSSARSGRRVDSLPRPPATTRPGR